jgi:FkbH-like protein
LTESELLDWLRQEPRKLWAFRVFDRFGDSGLTGIISLERLDEDHAQIVDYVLSCRVMGRQVEKAMLHVALTQARKQKLQRVLAQYLPTAKNKPCLRFLESSGLQRRQESDIFEWDLREDYPLPDCIEIEYDHNLS